MNPYGKWQITYDKTHPGHWEQRWRFCCPNHIVYGNVYEVNVQWRDKYKWEARVLLNCRYFTDPICGYAPTLDQAKRIVETLLYETDTVLEAPKVEKDDLYYDYFLC